jgi:hypothetical protein
MSSGELRSCLFHQFGLAAVDDEIDSLSREGIGTGSAEALAGRANSCPAPGDSEIH